MIKRGSTLFDVLNYFVYSPLVYAVSNYEVKFPAENFTKLGGWVK